MICIRLGCRRLFENTYGLRPPQMHEKNRGTVGHLPNRFTKNCFSKFAGPGQNTVISLSIAILALSGAVSGQNRTSGQKKRWDSGTLDGKVNKINNLTVPNRLGQLGQAGRLGHVGQPGHSGQEFKVAFRLLSC